MSRRSLTALVISSSWLLATPASGGGGGGGPLTFQDETSTRLPTPLNLPSLSTNDTQEKDYAWGDVDQDGDVDLIVVRKEPFTTPQGRVNVLFMNEGVAEGHAINGVLVDRTELYVTNVLDAPGDEGFNTPTNDRDVQLFDLDGDGWLDMVTATTLTDDSTKILSHPRIYMNLGEDRGVWQGFRFEPDRIPQMHPVAGPRFCSVAVGDVTNDGHPDLYFGDYDSGGAQILDFDNRLLVNDGNGFFADESQDRMGDLFNYGGEVGFDDLLFSHFGAASEIHDMNGDG